MSESSYYIKIDSSKGYSQDVSYNLVINKYTPDGYELNENSDSAKAISIGDVVFATIDNPQDQDWYKFTSQQHAKVSIDLSIIPLGTDYNVAVFNSSQQLMNGSLISSDSNRKSWLILDPGDYYVQVYSLQGSSDQSKYILTINSFVPDAYEFNELSTTAKLISLNDPISATIDNPTDQDWYKVEFTQTGVMQVNISEIPNTCYLNIEVLDSNNQLMRKVETPVQSQFMCDVMNPGYYYLKISSNYGCSDSQAYKFSVTRKEKFELTLDHIDSNGDFCLALIANNPKSVKNATVIVEYDPNSQELNEIASFNPDSNYSVSVGVTGLKGIAVKTINEVNIRKKVIFYDMEDDAAEDMQDQSRIIDYLYFQTLNNANGSNIVKIMPGSTLSWYDSNVFVQNTEFSITPNVGTQSTLELATPVSQNITTNGLSSIDLSKLQKLLDENPQLSSLLENDESNIPESLDLELSNKILQDGNMTVFSDLVDPASNSSVYGNIRVPAGSYINPENIGVVLRNSFGQTRTTYPNSIGRFGFNQVPVGDYYISVIRDENLINSINSTIIKPIIVTGEKHIGLVDGEKTILIQELGYYYDTDYNNDGHMGNADLQEFMNTASAYNVVEGNTLYSDSITDIMPFDTSSTQKFDSNNDRKINCMDVSNAETASWGDMKDETSVDLHRYQAVLDNDSIPTTLSPGATGSFTISFIDTSKWYSEDLWQAFFDIERQETEVNNCYYHLIRLDSSSISTNVIGRRVRIFSNNPFGFIVTFTVEYRVPSTIKSGPTSINLGLQNYSQQSMGSVHFGSTSKNIEITGGANTPGTYDWYYTELTDSNGNTMKVYLSNLGENIDTSSNVTAIVANNSSNQGVVYNLIGGSWYDSGTYAYVPGGGVGTASVSSSVNSSIDGNSTLSYTTNTANVFSINFQKLKEDALNKLLEQIGLSALDFEPEETQLLLEGVAVGLDDNYFFSLFQRFGELDTHYDDYHFVTAKILIDSASTVFWAKTTVDAGAGAASAFATAAAEATAGGLCAATGVGAPAGAALEAGAIATVIDGAVCTAVSVVAARAAVKSKGFLEASLNYKNSLPVNNAGNFNSNLRELVGDPPSDMVKPQAHHVLPQKFINFFKGKEIDIHDPKYGSWVPESEHQGWSNEYNLDWESFIEPNLSVSQMENFARMLSQKYGFSIHF